MEDENKNPNEQVDVHVLGESSGRRQKKRTTGKTIIPSSTAGAASTSTPPNKLLELITVSDWQAVLAFTKTTSKNEVSHLASLIDVS